MHWIRNLREVGVDAVDIVGTKNAFLGEMLRTLTTAGVRVPEGFAITSDAFRYFIDSGRLKSEIQGELSTIDDDLNHLNRVAARIRNLVLASAIPEDLSNEILSSYDLLATAVTGGKQQSPHVAVRSSVTARGVSAASLAGQQETYLEVHGHAELLDSVKRCFASLFTARAIRYRAEGGVGHFDVALSVGVQHMVRASQGSSGVIFTLDPESGYNGVVLVTSAYGLGENVAQGKVDPDEFIVHKQRLRDGFQPLVWSRCGDKQLRLMYDEGSQRLTNVAVAADEAKRLSLQTDDVLTLARWSLAIEDHYRVAMDIEWARDGETGELFILQARPEKVQSLRRDVVARIYSPRDGGEILVRGAAVGNAVASGRVCVVDSPSQLARFRAGEILVAPSTDPDWEPIMKTAAAVVTNRGGRTSHAAIVARELGIPAVVGATGATLALQGVDSATVSCAEGSVGLVYRGERPFDVQEIHAGLLPQTRTQIMLNLAQPEKAFQMAQIPCAGVGLVRMEFVFASWVGIHPLALLRYDKLSTSARAAVDRSTDPYTDRVEFFLDRLSQGIGTVAAAFWPRPVILRFSDFKSNEYANLRGGRQFEPREANPTLGWRGASRYYHSEFRDGFLLEVGAVRRVREQFGFTNLKVMVPFCRTPEEGLLVLDTAAQGGLVRGRHDLEIFVMAEVPSNVLLVDEFAELFDGFSIGTNDLTQLILGVDRDSEHLASLFDERNEAVKRACAFLIERAHAAGRTVGVCGQAPSDHPEFAGFLVDHGIDSISLSPDAVVPTWLHVAAVERQRSVA